MYARPNCSVPRGAPIQVHHVPSLPKSSRAANVATGKSSGRRYIHMSPSHKTVHQLHDPVRTVATRLGDHALARLREMPQIVTQALLVEHEAVRNGLNFMVQSSPAPTIMMSEVLTGMDKNLKNMPTQNKDKPFIKVRSKPTHKEVHEIVQDIRKNGIDDTLKQNRAHLLSGTYGLFHNFEPQECPLYYFLKNSACTKKEDLIEMASTLFRDTCKEHGLPDDITEEKTVEFLELFFKYDQLQMSGLLYFIFNPEHADSLGYNAKPKGDVAEMPHLSSVIAKVQKDPTKVDDFCKHFGSKMQMRMVATPKLLQPGVVTVLNAANPIVFARSDANKLLKHIKLPRRLLSILGHQKTTAKERHYEEQFKRLEADKKKFIVSMNKLMKKHSMT